MSSKKTVIMRWSKAKLFIRSTDTRHRFQRIKKRATRNSLKKLHACLSNRLNHFHFTLFSQYSPVSIHNLRRQKILTECGSSTLPTERSAFCSDRREQKFTTKFVLSLLMILNHFKCFFSFQYMLSPVQYVL